MRRCSLEWDYPPYSYIGFVALRWAVDGERKCHEKRRPHKPADMGLPRPLLRSPVSAVLPLQPSVGGCPHANGTSRTHRSTRPAQPAKPGALRASYAGQSSTRSSTTTARWRSSGPSRRQRQRRPSPTSAHSSMLQISGSRGAARNRPPWSVASARPNPARLLYQLRASSFWKFERNTTLDSQVDTPTLTTQDSQIDQVAKPPR